MSRHGLFQNVNQLLTHRQDALTHAFHFRKPGGFQLIIAQYGRDHLRTKIRRAGVNTADRRFQLTEYASRGFGVFTHHGQTADALAVEGEDF